MSDARYRLPISSYHSLNNRIRFVGFVWRHVAWMKGWCPGIPQVPRKYSFKQFYGSFSFVSFTHKVSKLESSANSELISPSKFMKLKSLWNVLIVKDVSLMSQRSRQTIQNQLQKYQQQEHRHRHLPWNKCPWSEMNSPQHESNVLRSQAHLQGNDSLIRLNPITSNSQPFVRARIPKPRPELTRRIPSRLQPIQSRNCKLWRTED